jgi:trimeric autotransporter adhesin
MRTSELTLRCGALRRIRATVLLVLLFAVVPAISQDDSNWDPNVVRLSGSEPRLSEAAVVGSNLYVAGEFTSVNGVSANGIARWDGERWSALGEGIDGYPFAIAGSGADLFVGGVFWSSSVGWVNNIMRWDGGKWTALGSDGNVGVDGYVFAIHVDGDDVYVGGSFDGVAYNVFEGTSTRAGNIGVWHRSSNTWSALADGDSVGVNGSVSAIVRLGDRLYVGGGFDSVAGRPARRIAAYDLTQRRWINIGDVAPRMYNGRDASSVYSMVARDGRVHVSGYFHQIGGVDAAGVATYDPATNSWSTRLSDTSVQSVTSLQFHGDDLVAAAYWGTGDARGNGVLRWSNASTTATLDTIEGALQTIAAGDGAYLLGTFVDGASVTNLLRREGSTWRPMAASFVGSATASINTILAAGDDIFVAGRLGAVDTVGASNIARWHRPTRTWHPLGSDSLNGVDGFVSSMLLVGDDLYVGGQFERAGLLGANNVAVWNRTTNEWRALDAVDGNGVQGAVTSLAVKNGRVLVAGHFDSVGTLPTMGIALWSPDEGLLLPYDLGVPTLVTEVDIDDMAVAGDSLYLAGRLSYGGLGGGYGLALNVGGETALLTPNGMVGTIYDMTLYGGQLYIAGSFRSIETTELGGIARWDGSAWLPLENGGSEGVNGDVRRLAVVDGRLYAGGSFDSAGSIAASNIAAWDGTRWHALGSGTSDDVTALAADGRGVLVGGNFTRAGGSLAMQMARWSTAPSGVRVVETMRGGIAPNPVRDVARLRFVIDHPSDVELVVTDAIGNTVARRAPEHLDAGGHDALLDVRTLSPGVYFVTVSGDEQRTTLTFVVAP